MAEFTQQDLAAISDAANHADTFDPEHPFRALSGDSGYRIVDFQAYPVTGFQGIVVVPTDGNNKNPDWAHMTVAYGATDPSQPNDVITDVTAFAGAVRAGQPDQAIQLANRAEQISLAHGAGGSLNFTGHSLGGGLAEYAAVKKGMPATTFCAADPGLLLNPAELAWAKAHPDQLFDIRVADDWVTGFTNLVTTQKFNSVASVIWATGKGHDLKALTFDGNGPVNVDGLTHAARMKLMGTMLTRAGLVRGAVLADGLLPSGLGGPLVDWLAYNMSKRVALDEREAKQIVPKLNEAAEIADEIRRRINRIPDELEDAYDELQRTAMSMLGGLVGGDRLRQAMVNHRMSPEFHLDTESLEAAARRARKCSDECTELGVKVQKVLDGIVAVDAVGAESFMSGGGQY